MPNQRFFICVVPSTMCKSRSVSPAPPRAGFKATVQGGHAAWGGVALCSQSTSRPGRLAGPPCKVAHWQVKCQVGAPLLGRNLMTNEIAKQHRKWAMLRLCLSVQLPKATSPWVGMPQQLLCVVQFTAHCRMPQWYCCRCRCPTAVLPCRRCRRYRCR